MFRRRGPESGLYLGRREAGRRLANVLAELNLVRPLVVALPRGGVPVAFEVALRLGAPLDVLPVRKVGFPGQPELALGAVCGEGPDDFILNQDLLSISELDQAELQAVIEDRRTEVRMMAETLAPHRPGAAIAGADVVLVDDGLATGATAKSAVSHLRRGSPARILVAVPVASQEAVDDLAKAADAVICPLIPSEFGSVGAFYRDFSPVPTAEVLRLLDSARTRPNV